MGRELPSLIRALALGALCLVGAAACTPSPATPERARAQGSGARPSPAALSDAPGPDGAPIGLPPPKPLAHLDDGVRLVAGTGMGASRSGHFGEPWQLEDTRSLALLAEGRSALVRRGYDAIALVSLPEGKERWRKPIDYFDHARVSPDGSTIALCDSDRLLLLDPARGTTRPLGEHMREAAFSPDGTVLVASGPERGVTLFDVATARQTGRLEWPGDAPRGLELSPDGRRLAAWDGSMVRVWDFAKQRTVYLAEHDRATAYAWASERALLVGDDRGQLALADVDALPRPAAPVPLARLAAPVQALVVVPGTRRILADLDATFASLVDLATGKELGRLQKARDGQVVVSPDGSAAAATGGSPAVYDLASLAPRQQAAGHLGAVTALGVRDDVLATGGDDGAVVLWDVATRTPLGRRLGFDAIASLDVAPGNAPGAMAGAIAVGTTEGDILVYDRKLERRLLTLSLGEPGEYTAVSVAFAPDGKQLAAAGGERSVLVDLALATAVAAYPTSFRAARFSPELLVVGPSPVRVIRRRDGAELRQGDDRGAPDAFALGILEGRVAVSAESGEYRNSIAALGARVKQERGDGAAFQLGEPLAFSPDGAVLASVDDEIRFLATADGRELAHRARVPGLEPDRPLDVASVAFSGDGRTLFVGYESGIAAAVVAPPSPPPGKQLVPGLGRGELGLLADLGTTADAVGPRDLAAGPITGPSRTLELPGRAVSTGAHGATLLLADDDGDLFVYDRSSGAQGKPLFGGARAEPGPAGLFIVTARYDDPPTILGGAEPLVVDKECSKAFPVEPGTYLCITYRDISLRGARQASFEVKHDYVREVAVSDDTTLIALATEPELILLSAKDLTPIGRLGAPSASGLALSADGRWLACASHGVALLVDVRRTRIVRLFEGHRTSGVRLSSDGQRLATIGDERVRLWDAASGRVLALFGVGESPGEIALTANGDALLIAAGRELSVWQPPSGQAP